MDRGAWWATVHGVAKSRARLSDLTYLLMFYANILQINYISVKIKRKEIFTQTSKMKLKSTDVKSLVKLQELIYSK